MERNALRERLTAPVETHLESTMERPARARVSRRGRSGPAPANAFGRVVDYGGLDPARATEGYASSPEDRLYGRVVR